MKLRRRRRRGGGGGGGGGGGCGGGGGGVAVAVGVGFRNPIERTHSIRRRRSSNRRISPPIGVFFFAYRQMRFDSRTPAVSAPGTRRAGRWSDLSLSLFHSLSSVHCSSFSVPLSFLDIRVRFSPPSSVTSATFGTQSAYFFLFPFAIAYPWRLHSPLHQNGATIKRKEREKKHTWEKEARDGGARVSRSLNVDSFISSSSSSFSSDLELDLNAPGGSNSLGGGGGGGGGATFASMVVTPGGLNDLMEAQLDGSRWWWGGGCNGHKRREFSWPLFYCFIIIQSRSFIHQL